MIEIVSDDIFFKSQLKTILHRREFGSVIRNAAVTECSHDALKPTPGVLYISDKPINVPGYPVFVITKEDIPEGEAYCYKWGEVNIPDFMRDVSMILKDIQRENQKSLSLSRFTEENAKLKKVLTETKGSLSKAGLGQKMALEHIEPIDGYDISAYVQSCNMVSGDVLFVREAGTKILGVIGDVTSHGYEKGMYAAFLYGLAWSYVETSSLSSLSSEAFARYMIKNSNGYKCDNGDGQYGYTALFFEIGNDYIRFTNCGHQCYPIIIKKKQGPQVFNVETSVNGSIDTFTNTTTITSRIYEGFQDGDGLFLYTDGIIEVMNGKNASIEKEYSTNRLLNVIRDNASDHGWNCSGLLEYVKKDADAYSYAGSSLFVDPEDDIRMINDDITLCCLKRKGKENVSDRSEKEY